MPRSRPAAAESDPAGFDANTYSAFLAGPGWGLQNRWSWLSMMIDRSARPEMLAQSIAELTQPTEVDYPFDTSDRCSASKITG